MATNTPRLGKGMMTAAWLLVLALLAWSFHDWLQRQENPNRVVETARIGNALQVVLERNRAGHYRARGEIEGHPVDFLLDTGATTVSIPAEVARTLGLRSGSRVIANTANGPVTAYVVRLARVRVGMIELRDVEATINPSFEGNEVLLGMSFLKRLDFAQRGDTLTLTQPAQPR